MPRYFLRNSSASATGWAGGLFWAVGPRSAKRWPTSLAAATAITAGKLEVGLFSAQSTTWSVLVVCIPSVFRRRLHLRPFQYSRHTREQLRSAHPPFHGWLWTRRVEPPAAHHVVSVLISQSAWLLGYAPSPFEPRFALGQMASRHPCQCRRAFAPAAPSCIRPRRGLQCATTADESPRTIHKSGPRLRSSSQARLPSPQWH